MTSTSPGHLTTRPFLDRKLPTAVLILRIKQWIESYVATEDRVGLDQALVLLRRNLDGANPLPIEAHVIALKITLPLADWLHERQAYWEAVHQASRSVYGETRTAYWLNRLE